MSKTKYITSCENCPFAEWDGYYYPTTKLCRLSKAEYPIVYTHARAWWYKTPPNFCALRDGVYYKVSSKIPIG